MVKATVNKKLFAQRLSDLMESNSETVYTLADILHLSAPTISRYSNAEMAPKITTIEVLANYFKVNPAWLMGYDVPRELTPDVMNEDDILTQAAHMVGHKGPLSDEERSKVALAIRIALAKNNK